MLCCETGEKWDWGLRTVEQVHLEQWRRAAWRPRCVTATAGIGPRVGKGCVIPSGMRRGDQWGSNRGRWLVGPTDGFFWECGRGDREKTQRTIKVTADYSGREKRRIKQGGDVLREQFKGLDIMMRPHKRCQMIKEAETKWAIVRVRF